MKPASAAKTVGIPRTLLAHTYYPAWERFFTACGLKVVASGPTSRPMLDDGVKYAVTDACVPIKLMHGHIADLARRGVDYIFVPRVISTNGRTVYCPKFLGLPDMITGSIPDLPELITPRYDAREGRAALERAALAVAAQLRLSEELARRALGEAKAAHQDHLETVRAGGRRPADGRLRLAVIGYPYLIEDAYLSLGLLEKLAQLGVTVVTAQELDPATWLPHRTELPKDLFWTYSEEAVCAGYHFLADPTAADGVIHVTAFGCGPDSVANRLLSLRAAELGDRPFMTLMVDEHSGEAGVRTRVEAFVDMVARGRKSRGKLGTPPVVAADPPPRRPRRAYARRRRRVSFPYLGTLPGVFQEVLVELGHEVVMPQRPSRRTLTLGTAMSPEFACLPLKILMGTYLEVVAAGADTLIASGGVGPCRAGLYSLIHEKVLRAAGHDLEMITLEPPRLDLRDFAAKLHALNARGLPPWRYVSLVSRAWHKVQALDEVEQRLHQIRPREAARGRASAIWADAQAAIIAAKDKRRIEQARDEALASLAAVPRKQGFTPLRVGIVGEIYVVVEPASNLEIEELLEGMGVETARSIYMSGWTKDSNLFGRPGRGKPVRAEDAAHPYLPEMIGGHGQESVGNAVLFAAAGFDGVVQLAPFTCIPEIVAKSVLERVSRQIGIPVLSLSLDEQTGRAGLETRVEAFVDLLKRNRAQAERRRPEVGGANSPLAVLARDTAGKGDRTSGTVRRGA